MTFLDGLHAIGTLPADHDTEHNGTSDTPPSIYSDDGKETNGEEAPRTTIRTPRT